MSIQTLRITTRKSPLAMWQAIFVKTQLEKHHSTLAIELIPMTTKGDILDNIAVNSIKDIPATFPNNLGLMAICQRGDPRDAFVSNQYDSLDALPDESIIGTSSLRRQYQLCHTYPNLVIRNLRGNIETRLNKLGNSEYDGIILAAAGLKRLSLETRIPLFWPLPSEHSLPAAGQGAIGI